MRDKMMDFNSLINFEIILWILGIFILFVLSLILWEYPKYRYRAYIWKTGKLIAPKNSIKDVGNFFYYTEHNTLKPFIRDTIFVIVDSLIIIGVIHTFMIKDWVLLFGMILARLLIYMILRKTKKTYLLPKIKKKVSKDAKHFEEREKILSKYEKKQKNENNSKP